MSETLPYPLAHEIEVIPRLEDYPTRPIEEAFDMPDLLQALEARHGPLEAPYLVEFRSLRRPGADEALLNDKDEAAYLEASAAPGFLFYFKGGTDSQGNCISFCLWKSVEEGRAASSLPLHAEATTIVPAVYSRINLQRRQIYLDPDSPSGVGFLEVFPPMEMSFEQ